MSTHSDRFADTPGFDADDACSALIVDEGAVAQVREGCVAPDLLERTAGLFSAMGDPTRLRLLEALAIEELCVCDLAQLTQISQSGVSHQLRALRRLGLVGFRRDGNRAIYRLADDHVRALLAQGFVHAAEPRDER